MRIPALKRGATIIQPLRGVDAMGHPDSDIGLFLKAEEVGEPPRKRLDLLVQQAFGHYDEWFVSKKAPYVRPFMAALTAEALIDYCEQKKKDQAKVAATIKTGMDWLWKNIWDEKAEAFKYTDRELGDEGTKPAPDLNLLIAPAYAWLYHRTGIAKYRDQAEAIFAGGVKNAFLDNAKHFNQNYRWSFACVNWCSQAPEPFA